MFEYISLSLRYCSTDRTSLGSLRFIESRYLSKSSLLISISSTFDSEISENNLIFDAKFIPNNRESTLYS